MSLDDTQDPKVGKNKEEKAPENELGAPHVTRDALNSSERIEVLRTRLYERGGQPESRARHSLRESQFSPEVTSVRRNTLQPMNTRPQATPLAPTSPTHAPIPENPLLKRAEQIQQPLNQINPMTGKKPFRSYRKKFILIGLTFFLVALSFSSFFLFKGNNLISGENISVEVSGPLTIGGGEELQLQIGVSNQNTVPIESATLIIEYPKGTQSVDVIGKELFSDRQQLTDIQSGEVLNIPVKARVFGEENEEKIVKVSVEYRVAGSNATFFKEATPLRFKISSSPVVLKVDSVKSISSGQEVEIELTVSSNSPAPLTNVLIKATYPETGFDFSSAEPEAISGRDTWLIKELIPGAKKTITLIGVVVGKQDEERVFSFSVGVPSDKNSYTLFSVFTTVQAQIAIEQPFLDLSMSINGDTDETVVLNGKQRVEGQIDFSNSLDDTLYDGIVSLEFKGNSLGDIRIDAREGFYDSSSHTITWEPTEMESLREIAPGSSKTLGFSIDFQDQAGKIPEIGLTVTAKAQRVFEDRVPQELTGTISRTIRIESGATLASSAIYSDGPFTNSGPTPPVAEKVTEYTYLLTVVNGNNELTGSEVTAVLPPYITWLDKVTDGDTVTYNSVTRTMTWKIGEMKAKERQEVWIQVSLKPSLSQVDTTPTILGIQRFKATNKFTSTTIRTEAPAITTELKNDPDESIRDGRVRGN